MDIDNLIKQFIDLQDGYVDLDNPNIQRKLANFVSFKKSEEDFINFEEKIREKYTGISILDLDVLGLKYHSQSHQVLILGLTLKELTYEKLKDIEFSKIVSLREFLFGLLCSCPDLSIYEDEIDSLFVKRMADINIDTIYKHKEWGIYTQIGQNITPAIKFSAVLQHDIDHIIKDDIEKIFKYNFSLNNKGKLDISMFNVKWGKDVITLLKKMNRDFEKKKIISPLYRVQFLAINNLLELVKNGASEVINELYNNVFFFGISNLLKEMSIESLGDDYTDFSLSADKFFNNDNFSENLNKNDFTLFKYLNKSSNYIQRVINKGNLKDYGAYDTEAFFSGASLCAYHPLGPVRSDYQFILYFIINHAFNTYNKTPRSHIDKDNDEKAKENMLKGYMLGKRFKLDNKDIHNFAITLNIIFTLVDEINDIMNLHLNEVVNEVVRLKTTHNKLSQLLSDSYNQLKNTQQHIEDERLKREDTLLLEKNKLYKEIYKDLKSQLKDELEDYKKENNILRKKLDASQNLQHNEMSLTTENQEDTPEVKYISDLNVLVIGDYNLKTTLLESVFSSVKKIDGNNSSNLDLDSALGGVDLIVFQYTYCKHKSIRFVKEAIKRNMQIVYFKHVNERKILDEIYASIYR